MSLFQRIKKKLIALSALVLLFGIPMSLRWIPDDFWNFFKPSQEDSSALHISWRELRSLDLETGRYPESLKKLELEPVKIPGFIVPLEDDAGRISEFLLVPSPQACIHVPPPPGNQMIHVFLEKSIPYSTQYRAVFVTGNLKIVSTKSMYGSASYTMKGMKVERFKKSL